MLNKIFKYLLLNAVLIYLLFNVVLRFFPEFNQYLYPQKYFLYSCLIIGGLYFLLPLQKFKPK